MPTLVRMLKAGGKNSRWLVSEGHSILLPNDPAPQPGQELTVEQITKIDMTKEYSLVGTLSSPASSPDKESRLPKSTAPKPSHQAKEGFVFNPANYQL